MNTWEKLTNGLCFEKQLKTLKDNTTCLLRFNKKTSLIEYSSNLISFDKTLYKLMPDDRCSYNKTRQDFMDKSLQYNVYLSLEDHWLKEYRNQEDYCSRLYEKKVFQQFRSNIFCNTELFWKTVKSLMSNKNAISILNIN